MPRLVRIPGWLPLWTALALTAAASIPAQALPPRDELLRLVPEDAGFCFVVQDLRTQATTFLQSDFVSKIRTMPLVIALAEGKEMQKLREVEQFLREHLKTDWTHLRDDILGDAVVLAYWPGPPSKPEQEQGVILVRARDGQVLADLVQRLHLVMKNSEKPFHQSKHNGKDYVHWEDNKKHFFSYLHGPVLVLTHREELLRRIIDLDVEASPRDEPVLSRRLQRLGLDKALAVLWINPKAFEAEMVQKAAQAFGPEAIVRKTALKYWKALEGVALSVSLRPADVELGLVLMARAGQLPAPVRRMFTQDGQASDLWRRFPDNALLTVAGQVDAVALTDLLGTFLPEEVFREMRTAVNRQARAALDKDLFQDVLPFLGPDWGFCVAAPPSGDAAWFPHLTWALRIQPDDKEPPVDRTVWSALNTVATWAVIAYNSTNPDQLSLKRIVQDKVEVKYFANERRFPTGFQPAFALKGGYLVLASSPAAIRSFRDVPAKGGAEAVSEIPLLRLSLQEVRRYAKERLNTLAGFLAEKDQTTREEAARKLSEALAVSEVLNGVDISYRSSSEQLTVILRLRTAQPLRK